MYQSQEQTI